MKRWFIVVVLVTGSLAGGLLVWKSRGPLPLPEAVPRSTFTDVTTAAGITFHHEAGARGAKLDPETFGSGAAWFDHDGDGLTDLFLVNGNVLADPLDACGASTRPEDVQVGCVLFNSCP